MDISELEADAISRAGAAGRPWWRADDVAVAVGPMFAHVRRGRVLGWGVEPVGDGLVAADGSLTELAGRLRRRLRTSTVVSAAAGSAAVLVASAAAAVAVLRHRPHAA